MGNAGIGAQKDNKMRIQIVCSILAEVQNELKEGQKPTKIQAIAQKDDIAEHVISELMQTVARENECRYDEKTGMAIRIVDGKVIEANTESFKKIDQRRKEAGREVKTIKTNTEIDR